MPTRPLTQHLYWLPLFLGTLFAVFISLFSLDGFDLGLGTWGTLVALAMHLLPTAGLVVALVVAWRLEAAGSVVYAIAALVLAILVGGESPAVFVIAGPPLVIGLRFLADHVYHARHRKFA